MSHPGHPIRPCGQRSFSSSRYTIYSRTKHKGGPLLSTMKLLRAHRLYPSPGRTRKHGFSFKPPTRCFSPKESRPLGTRWLLPQKNRGTSAFNSLWHRAVLCCVLHGKATKCTYCSSIVALFRPRVEPAGTSRGEARGGGNGGLSRFPPRRNICLNQQALHARPHCRGLLCGTNYRLLLVEGTNLEMLLSFFSSPPP